jgi:DNA polymerase-3 subunit gamma/tau
VMPRVGDPRVAPTAPTARGAPGTSDHGIDFGAPMPSAVHQVLSRKYRPQGFAEMVGQEHVARVLRNALASGRVGHAYLFIGPRGVGKTTAARIFAKALNCTGRPEGGGPESVDPCGACPSCRDITAGSDLDVVEIDGASNSGVDDVRSLREQVGYAAVRARHRIWIVDEVHMLSLPAFNAFLKTLEEPPPRVKFLFCTTEEHKLPDTFRSRCQRIEFRPIDERSIATRLAGLAAREGVEVEAGLCEEIARGALGGLRDAESLLEQLLAAAGGNRIVLADLDALTGRAPAAALEALRSAVATGDAGAALDAMDACLASGGKPGVLLDQWLDVLRRELAEAARKPETRSVARVARSIDVLLQKRAHLKAGADGVLIAQVAAVELARLPDARDLDRLVEALRAGAAVPPALPAPPPPRAVGATAPPRPRAAPPPSPPSAPAPRETPPSSRAAPVETEEARRRWPELVAHVEASDPRLAATLRRVSPGALEDGGAAWRLETSDAMARTAFDRREVVMAFRRATRAVLGREIGPRIVSGTSPAAGDVPTTGVTARGGRVSSREAREHPTIRLVAEATDGTLLDMRPASDDVDPGSPDPSA